MPGAPLPVGGLIPYGTQIPTIKAELKPDNLPSWDGNPDTAIQYFFDVQELASLGGHILDGLGYWLWKRLEPGSTIRNWYGSLSPLWKTWMRSHYLNYLEGIKIYWLGNLWQQQKQREYSEQYFRQPGHSCESPHDFIMRRILYTREPTWTQPKRSFI